VTQPQSRRPIGVWLIALPFAAAMAAIPLVDRAWTVYLTQVRIPALVDIMRRTLFEGDGIGGSDLSILLFLAIVSLYLRSQSAQPGTWLLAWRPVLGYLLVSALAAGLGAVHALKWVLGRARPWSVLGREQLPYSDWYRTGAHFITQGIYRGSFPSGHTAAVFLLMTFVYAYCGDPTATASRRAWAWPLGGLVLLYTGGMGIASSMARSHWLSDAIGAAGIVWVLIHLLYFRILRVPEQRAYWLRTGRHAALAPYWELRFCGWGFVALLGFMSVALGLRALWEMSPPYLAALIPVGGLLWWVGYPRARAILVTLRNRLAAGA
jgi:membrane-associated phospholipid phosphatase